MDYRELTTEDIEQYEAEIKNFMNYRNVMFWSAIGSFGGAATFLFLAIYLSNINYQFFEISMWLIILSILAGITLFILRSALFNRRISNRKELIRKAKNYQKQNQNQ